MSYEENLSVSSLVASTVDRATTRDAATYRIMLPTPEFVFNSFFGAIINGFSLFNLCEPDAVRHLCAHRMIRGAAETFAALDFGSVCPQFRVGACNAFLCSLSEIENRVAMEDARA